MLSSYACQVAIIDSTDIKMNHDRTEFHNNECFHLNEEQELYKDLYIHSLSGSPTMKDTIVEVLPEHLRTNSESTYLAVMKYDGAFNYSGDSDTVFSREKAGIRIYSYNTGVLKHFVACYGYYPMWVFPIALSSDGNKIIYNEGERDVNNVWFVDFPRNKKISLSTTYDESIPWMEGGFSPNDKYFFLHELGYSRISIYSSSSNMLIHQFNYEKCDSVFWNEDSHICVLTNGYIYEWDFVSPQTNVLQIGH